MSKTFKVRVEDTKDGCVQEFETNCVSVIAVEESQEVNRFPTTVFSGGHCSRRALFALMRALDNQKEAIANRILNGILRNVFEGATNEDSCNGDYA